MSAVAADLGAQANGWETCRLADLCQFKPPKSIVRQQLDDASPVSFVPMDDLGQLTKYFQPKIVREFGKLVKSYTYFADGDVLCAKITPCFENGKLGIARNLENGIGFGSSEFVVMRPKPSLCAEFLYYFLSRDVFRTDGARVMDGAVGHKRVPKSYFEDLRVPVPPLDEQKRIVAVLDQAFAALDCARAHAEANLADATELVAHAKGHLLNPNQSGWQLRPLSEMISIKHGFAFKSEFFASEGEYVLLTPGNFFEAGGFRNRGSKQKYYVGNIPEGFVLSEGDLLMAMTEQAPGLLGSCILVPENDRFLHNQRLGLIQPLDGVEWHSPYFSHVFNLGAFRKALDESCTGIKVRHTSPDKIKSASVPVPPTLDIQRTLASQLDELAERVALLKEKFARKLADINELRQSLLQKAFTGELS